MIKPNARILDATAANRVMWKTRESDKVIWIDIENELTVKPDFIMDCTNTEFDDGQFHTIIFDPPHSFGRTKNTGQHQTPSQELQIEKWGRKGSYYGFDKYPTKRELLGFINKSQLEFQRILSDDGMLWFKWAEIHCTLDSILPFFKDWKIMLRIESHSSRAGAGKTRTWWTAFTKNNTSHTNKNGDNKHES